MKKNTTNNNATTNNTPVKEETTMRTLEELIIAVETHTKTSEKGYIKNDILKEVLGYGKNHKIKRAELIEQLYHAYKYQQEGDELMEHETGIEFKDGVPVGDLEITYDNAPAQDVPEFNNTNICDVMFRVMNESILNHNKTFISDYILLSCVRKVLFGEYSTKTDKDGKYTKKKNVFTAEQDALANSFIASLIAKYKYERTDKKGYKIKDNYHLQPVYQGGNVKYQINYQNKTIIRTENNIQKKFSLTREYIGLINKYCVLIGFIQ